MQTLLVVGMAALVGSAPAPSEYTANNPGRLNWGPPPAGMPKGVKSKKANPSTPWRVSSALTIRFGVVATGQDLISMRIVPGTLLRIRQDFVGCLDLCKQCCSLLDVTIVPVWM